MFTPLKVRGLIFCLALVCTVSARAADPVQENIQRLRTSDDFRVKTQAALALGASDSSLAVQPLCDALADGSRTVRIASATALSRLRKGGSSCIESRLSLEKDDAVLASLKSALARLAGGEAEPLIGAATKYLVAIQTLSGPERLNGPVRGAFVKIGRADSTLGFAPAGQTAEAASAELAKYKGVKAFLLAPKLSRPVYEGGMLQIKMSVAILSYPGNALIGSFTKTVGMAGINSQNTEAENELVVTAAEEAMKQFLALLPTLN